MCLSILRLVCISLLFVPCQSCVQCFVDMEDQGRLCWGHIIDEFGIRNMDSCFVKLEDLFNSNEAVIQAARVGKGYDKNLKEILNAEILPIMREFDQKRNSETVYQQRLEKAASNFIAAASKLPRASGCIPPCGNQSVGAIYNCISCKYDSCELPLDCPVKEIKVMENSRSRLWCVVPFDLPQDVEVIWRFAEEVKTQQVEQFKKVTAGANRLYSIPPASSEHQGTYQCEIYLDRISIVRLYFYITVTPQDVVGHTELQEIFDLSLLPGGQLPREPRGSFMLPLLPFLLAACLTTSLLLLFLSLGALFLLMMTEDRNLGDEEDLLPQTRN